MKHSNKLAALSVAAAALASTASCQRSDYRHAEGMVWHTAYHVTYESSRDLTDSIISVFNEVGSSLNVFDPNSLASVVNRRDSVEVDRHFREVYDMSVKVNRLTSGAFDPTLGPLITAWGFGKGHKASSDTLRLDSLLALTGVARTRIHDGVLIKSDARMQFNFSAIAKGYGADCVAEMLARNGSANYLVEIGGEIRCGGRNESGGYWRVSVDRPSYSDDASHESQCVVSVTGCGLATSGNYRNFHVEGGSRYGHTISSRTGRPVQTDVISATVIAQTCMEADALSTSMMAMGSEKSKGLAARLRYPTLLVLSDLTTWESPEFREKCTFKQ